MMISFIKGILFEQRQDSILVDVNGVGYDVIIPARAFSRLPPEGTPVFVYTYLHMLDNEFKLYGFLTREDQELFRKLLSISGVGAKGALNVLGFMEPDSFYRAIASQDEKALTRIPGIGKKSAQRLIFELRDKIKDRGVPKSAGTVDNNFSDLVEALEVLGYNRSEIFPLIVEMQEKGQLDESVEGNIRKVLQEMALRK
ncbi:MAG: Holliday junction branch migration protein RuvA [Syntrophomonadaceae bacterium]|nr:Holliday junction branch migration protein RuvA [Syntrophomonadaceae bacterium]